MERFLYWYIGNPHILTNTYTTALTTKQVARKVLFLPGLIEHVPLSQIKMTYTKKNIRIKQMLKENRYQESIISKIFKRITYNHSFPRSLTQATDIQEEEIRMSINLPHVGQRLALGNQKFPVGVRLLAMCRGELSAVIAHLMSKCL